MGLKLSSDLRNQEQPQTGIDITGLEGKEYDLDYLEKLKNRQASDSPLVVHVTDDEIDQEADIAVGTTKTPVNISRVDYTNYLLDDDPKEPSYSQPLVSMRRPVIIWEDGTEDPNVLKVGRHVYDDLDDMKKAIENIAKQLADHLGDITNVIRTDENGHIIGSIDKIPTVGALYQYLSLYSDSLQQKDFIFNGKFYLRTGSIRHDPETNDYKVILSNNFTVANEKISIEG